MRDNDILDSKMFVLFAEIERIFQAVASIPSSRHSIPATRLFLQDIGKQAFASGFGDKELLEKIGKGILELEQIEKSIEKRRSPNLGQSLSTDFSGSNVLARFVRYEGHIERSLYKALTEFQKLQILRANRWMPNPPDDLTENSTCET